MEIYYVTKNMLTVMATATATSGSGETADKRGTAAAPWGSSKQPGFLCKSGDRCISEELRCDDDTDDWYACADGSDEEDCPNQQ